MSVKMRQLVEKEISTAVVDALLQAGYAIKVDNGEDENEYSTKRGEILDAMFQTDQEFLFARKSGGISTVWVYLVYGNDGWDVISDYTVNLDPLIGEGTAVDALVEKYR